MPITAAASTHLTTATMAACQLLYFLKFVNLPPSTATCTSEYRMSNASCAQQLAHLHSPPPPPPPAPLTHIAAARCTCNPRGCVGWRRRRFLTAHAHETCVGRHVQVQVPNLRTVRRCECTKSKCLWKRRMMCMLGGCHLYQRISLRLALLTLASIPSETRETYD